MESIFNHYTLKVLRDVMVKSWLWY